MIEFETTEPEVLLRKFQAAIKAGKVTTWKADPEGDFGHLAEQWKDHGWLTPIIDPEGALCFYFIASDSNKDKREVYAYLHSKMMDTFISHFPDDFERVSATPNPVEGDGELD